jgi:hypothetical protein
MGVYSSIVDGKVLDWKFKRAMPHVVSFSIGNIHIGQIFKINNSYTGVLRNGHQYNGIGGFRTRHDAAAYLLFIGGYRDQAR